MGVFVIGKVFPGGNVFVLGITSMKVIKTYKVAQTAKYNTK